MLRQTTQERTDTEAIKQKFRDARKKAARSAYATHGTIAAVIRACRCDSITAKKLIAELQSEARP